MRRLPAILLLSCALAPGLWLRDPPRQVVTSQSITATLLPIERRAVDMPGFALLGVWHLVSPNTYFGGYSALLRLPSGRLLAFSDTGHVIGFGDPQGQMTPTFMRGIKPASGKGKANRDIEAATRDPDTGRIWIALESTNSIRSSDDLTTWKTVRPKAMRKWPSNQGPEAMTRLRDGRFLVLSESRESFDESSGAGLLFRRDPVAGGRPIRFHFIPPKGFRPVDAASLPDGRVLILLRKFQLAVLPKFTSRLVLADPAEIEAGKPWPWQPVGPIGEPLPSENYEGLAVAPYSNGVVVVWLISDDNGSVFQRTLLIKLLWRIPPR